MTGYEQSLERFVPRMASEWGSYATDPRWAEQDASLCFVDISGFTNLSEKLARRGRIGAEELTEVLNHVFGSMLALAYQRRGSLLKFGGDALLLMFRDVDHVAHACDAAVEMRAALRESANLETSVGRVALRMSVGVHTGAVHFFRVGESHRELIVAGPTASRVTEMEGTAVAGEIVISQEVRACIGEEAAPNAKGDGFLLRWRRARLEPPGVQLRPEADEGAVIDCVPVALRGHLGGDLESEHRQATIGFVKFKDIDTMLTEEGPEAVAEALDELITVTQSAADEEGVTFLATDVDENGGKIILAAGVPFTHDDDEGRVLRSVRRIVDASPTLPIQVGVNRGHVFAGEIGMPFRSTYTVIGDTVNLAARLMAAASRGEIYSTSGVLDRAHSVFESTALEPFHVKGKSAPVQAFAVGAELGGREAGTRHELPFAGRDEELAALVAALESDLSGTGQVAEVVGPAGIGKSRLVEEATAALDSVSLFEMRAEPNGTTSPYRAFRDTARRLLGVDRGDGETMAAAIVETVRAVTPHLEPLAPLLGRIAHVEMAPTREVAVIEPRFLADRLADVVIEMLDVVLRDRTVLVVDDAHWMDDASAQLLNRLAIATAGRSWAMVSTRRPEEGGFRPSGPIEIELGRLAAEAVEGMVIEATTAAPLRPHEVDALVERCGGSPLFLEELLGVLRERGSVEALPESLDAVVGASIDALPPLSRQVLRYASVLGGSFRTDTLRQLLSRDEISLDQATRATLADFLDADGRDRIRFRHAMMRDAAYEGLSYRRRRALHLRAGEILETESGRAGVAGIMSHHFAEAQEHERAWRYSCLAGRSAEELYANVEAAAQYERALEAARSLPGVGSDERVELLRRLGHVRLLAGVFDAARDSYTRALRLTGDDPEVRVGLLLSRALVRRQASDYRTALRDTATARRSAEALVGKKHARAQARIAVERGSIRVWQQRPAEVGRLARVAEAHARRADDLETLAKALDLLDWTRRMTGDTEADAHHEETLAIFEELGDLTGVGSIWNNLGAEAFFEGRWEDAIDAYEKGRRAALKAGDHVGAAITAANIAELLTNQGRVEEAEPLLREAIRVLIASGHAPAVVFAETELARVLIRRGDYRAAEDLLDDIRSRGEAAGEPMTIASALIQLADAKLRQNEHEEVLTMTEELGAEAGVAAVFGPSLARVEALALAATGAHDAALERVERGMADAVQQGLLYDKAVLLAAKLEIVERAGGSPDPLDLREVKQAVTELDIRDGFTLVLN